MRWAEAFIAVDWGTTNRRAWRLDPDGAVAGEIEDEKGVVAVPSGGFHLAIAEIRERLGDLPRPMTGTVGSNRGWVEAPYVPCPAGLADLAARICWIDGERAAIVPGVALGDDGAANVMRGEEVQVLSTHAQGWIEAEAALCHPGTHHKWVPLADGRIAAFRTVMTGEMFNMLKERHLAERLP